MRPLSLLPAALFLLATAPAQAAAYRCTDAAGAVVFQDKPCSTGPSTKLRTAPPAPVSREEPVAEPGFEWPGEEGVAAEAPPPRTGHDNVREYLDTRERERQQLRGEQKRAFAEEDARMRRSSALSKIDARLHALNLQKVRLATDTWEHRKATADERALRGLRERVEAGSAAAVEEADSLR